MIVYNVTINVDTDVATEWLHWMKTVHIPDVMSTGLFLDNRICRVLAEEDGGLTYAIQYTAADMTTYERYKTCLLYTSPSPRDRTRSRMPSSA